jgi:ferredoxin
MTTSETRAIFSLHQAREMLPQVKHLTAEAVRQPWRTAARPAEDDPEHVSPSAALKAVVDGWPRSSRWGSKPRLWLVDWTGEGYYCWCYPEKPLPTITGADGQGSHAHSVVVSRESRDQNPHKCSAAPIASRAQPIAESWHDTFTERRRWYIICEPCIGTKDSACGRVPSDCIHPRKDEPEFEAAEMLASILTNASTAARARRRVRSRIFALDETPEKWKQFIPVNAEYFQK